ncbi:MAG: glycosyltransferase family 9 protein, partial [Candidatus Krumholzibacteriota bacterium]|nr:glycosyltransferase family 9 protein [Candidatus Krumholzibacteriota bacterium]
MNLPHTDHTKRLCVVAPNWLGDAVMSRSLIGLLGASGVRLSVMAPMYTARVYAGMRELDELIVDGEGGRMRRVRERARTFRALRPDAVILLPPSFSSAVAPWLAGVKVRVGNDNDSRSVLLSARLVPRAHRGEHLAESYARLGRLALGQTGLRVPERWEAADLHVSERDRSEAESVCGEFLAPGERYVVVVPSATFGPAKSWPEARFRELCSKLARSIPVLVAGTAREEPMCRRVSDRLMGVHNVAGTTSLGGFIGLLGGACSVVANDSGP